MNNLFSPTSGIGMNYVRVPMGASDFVAGGTDYSYDDVPAGQTDPNLAGFSIAHDAAYIIPALQQAQAINPALKLMATPWSPPGWMKDSGSMVGGRLLGRLLPEYYGSFANYFAKFVQAYAAQNLPVDAITVQNEPQALPTDYPGNWMTADDEANFVHNYLAPAFASNNITAKIIGLDHNWGFHTYADELLSDPAARADLAGVAYHCYGGDPTMQSIAQYNYPTAGVYFTECTTTGPTTNWAGDFKWDMQNLVIGATRNWAKTVLKWNLALDTDYGPHLGGCGTCKGLVTIDQSTGAVSYNLDYYSIGHISKFVKPGAYRIASSDLAASGLDNVAFINPDGSKALIAINSASRSQTFHVRWGGESFQYSLPAGAAATFTWGGTQATPNTPAAPTALTATPGDGKAKLDWTFSPLASSYNVKRATSAGGPFTTIASNVALPTFTDSSVTNGTTYYYVVTAANALGESAATSAVSATPNPQAPLGAGSSIQAESFDVEHGIAVESTSDTGGGQDVGYAEDGDHLGWNRIDFGTGGYAYATIRAASGSSGGTVELRLGSPTGSLLSTFTVTNTGGWQNWTTLKNPMSSNLTGVQTVYLVHKGPSQTTGIANLNWIKFTPR